MMTSSSKIYVADAFPGMSSRDMGDAALLEVFRALDESDGISLDFGGKAPSPSFADQLVGGLAARLGLEAFRKRIRLENVPELAQPLIRHVILRRAAQRPA